jgi:hypothetical protein
LLRRKTPPPANNTTPIIEIFADQPGPDAGERKSSEIFAPFASVNDAKGIIEALARYLARQDHETDDENPLPHELESGFDVAKKEAS